MDDKYAIIDDFSPGVENPLPARDNKNQLIWSSIKNRLEYIQKYNANNPDRSLTIPENLSWSKSISLYSCYFVFNILFLYV